MIARRLLLAISFLSAWTSIAFAAPALPIEKVIKVAQSDLKDRKLEKSVFITSVTLEPAERSSPERWVIHWSQTIELEPTKREVGLEIAMDGSVSRLVNVTTAEGSPVVSEARKELANHRTRSDRPSILDLKH